MTAVAKLQKPVLDRLSKNIRETLREFLPNVKEVSVGISAEERFRANKALLQEIVVDDGSPTRLATKGDGVQSLAALSTHSTCIGACSRCRAEHTYWPIEEPDHIYIQMRYTRLKDVIAENFDQEPTDNDDPLPLLVDRTVRQIQYSRQNHNKAKPAVNVLEIRSIPRRRGRQTNLQRAGLILLLEGEDDRRTVRALLMH